MKNIRFILLFLLFLASIPLNADELGDDSTARDDTQVYHINENIDMVSTLKFNYDKPRIMVKSVYPQLQYTDYVAHPDDENKNDVYNNELLGTESNPPDDTPGVFNAFVAEIIKEEMAEFKSQVLFRQTKKNAKPGKNNLYIDYDTSVINSGRSHILSVRFSIQAAIGGTNPYHYHRVLNYDLDTNERIELQDLFHSDADYLHALSNYTSRVLMRRFQNHAMVYNGTAPKTENYAIWNLKPRGLLITFDTYQVAPSIQGAQTVFVPYSALKEVMSTKSPISSCIKHRATCVRNNVLTGGFIDEAINTRHGGLNPILSQR